MSFDTRTVTDFLTVATQRIYEVSGGQISDFSPASPIMPLVEGQAIALSTLVARFNEQFDRLQFALLERMGITRKAGAKALVPVRFQLNAIYTTPFVIPAGYRFTVGDSTFQTVRDLTIPALANTTDPANYAACTVDAEALELGSDPNGKTGQAGILVPIDGVTGIFLVGAVGGGQDSETDGAYLARVQTYLQIGQGIAEGTLNPLFPFEDVARGALGEGAAVLVLGGVKPDLSAQVPAVTLFALNPDGSTLNATQIANLQTQLSRGAIGLEGAVYVANLEQYPTEIHVFVYVPPTVQPGTIAPIIRDTLVAYFQPNGTKKPGQSISLYNDILDPVMGALREYLGAGVDRNTYGVSRAAIGPLLAGVNAGDMALPNKKAIAAIRRIEITVTAAGVDTKTVFTL